MFFKELQFQIHTAQKISVHTYFIHRIVMLRIRDRRQKYMSVATCLYRYMHLEGRAIREVEVLSVFCVYAVVSVVAVASLANVFFAPTCH